jgi:hypothetical protein
MSVAVGFQYMLNVILLSSYEIAISAKLISSSETSDIVKCIVRVEFINMFKISYFCYFLYLLQFAGEL